MPRKKVATPVRKRPTSSDEQSTSQGRRSIKGQMTRRRKPLWQLELAYYMKTTHLLIPRLPFCRVCHSVLQEVTRSEFRWQKGALDCLQEAAEAYMVNILSEANLLARHTNRVTLMPRDIRLLKILKDI